MPIDHMKRSVQSKTLDVLRAVRERSSLSTWFSQEMTQPRSKREHLDRDNDTAGPDPRLCAIGTSSRGMSQKVESRPRHTAGGGSSRRSISGFRWCRDVDVCRVIAAGGVAIAVALRRTARQLCSRSRPHLSPAIQGRRRRAGRSYQADRRITWSRGCRSCPSRERWGRATVTGLAGDSISGAFFR